MDTSTSNIMSAAEGCFPDSTASSLLSNISSGVQRLVQNVTDRDCGDGEIAIASGTEIYTGAVLASTVSPSDTTCAHQDAGTQINSSAGAAAGDDMMWFLAKPKIAGFRSSS